MFYIKLTFLEASQAKILPYYLPCKIILVILYYFPIMLGNECKITHCPICAY